MFDIFCQSILVLWRFCQIFFMTQEIKCHNSINLLESDVFGGIYRNRRTINWIGDFAPIYKRNLVQRYLVQIQITTLSWATAVSDFMKKHHIHIDNLRAMDKTIFLALREDKKRSAPHLEDSFKIIASTDSFPTSHRSIPKSFSKFLQQHMEA